MPARVHPPKTSDNTKGGAARCRLIWEGGPLDGRKPPTHARLLDLVGRIKVSPSEEADRTENEFNLCELEIVLKSGARKSTRVEYHRGHFKNPMTDAEMEEKFRLMAGRHLPADRLDRLLGVLRGIENEPQVNGLMSATLA